MPRHDIVAIGASAGGVEALVKLLGDLPPDLPASIFVVLHLPPDSVSILPKILTRAGPLTARHPEDHEAIQIGRVYVAPPDRHLLLHEDTVRVINGPRENRHRPAIDALFRTAARFYGPRVIGVILTGTSDDGVAGLRAIKGRGGIAVVQDPTDATQPELPRNALEFVRVDHTSPIAEMGRLLDELVRQPAPALAPAVGSQLDKESRIDEMDLDVIENDAKVGTPSSFSCPDCGGVLWELRDDEFLRFRCRVGHAYTAAALAEEQRDSAENAIWAAFRVLEEHAAFARRLAVRARRAGRLSIAERFMERAEEASANAATLRDIITRWDPATVNAAASK